MIFINCEQGTPEWHQARAGVITASTFSDALSVLKRKSGDKEVGDFTDASDTLAINTAFERISGEPYGDTFQTYAMKRGSEQEAFARMRYEQTFSVIVEECGIVLTDDRLFGYSTDGFVGTDGMIEVKTPANSLKIMKMIESGDVEEYIHQMQGGLWITGRKYCDFIMYIPPLKGIGNDLYVKRIYRDENFIEDLEMGLLKFNGRVEQYVAKLNQALPSPVAEPLPWEAGPAAAAPIKAPVLSEKASVFA
jgi:exodeoxyribonuclease (lambda-induced)